MKELDGRVWGSSFPRLGCSPSGSVTEISSVFVGQRAAWGVPHSSIRSWRVSRTRGAGLFRAEISARRHVDRMADASFVRKIL